MRPGDEPETAQNRPWILARSMSDQGQTEKNSIRAYVFRFALAGSTGRRSRHVSKVPSYADMNPRSGPLLSRQGRMSKPVRWHNLGSVLRQLLSARQNWREAYLYRQLDERRRSASRVKQTPRVSYCRAQQWQRDHDLAGTSFLGSTRRGGRSRRAQQLDRYSLDLASRTR